MPVFTTDDLRPHIESVVDTLYSIKKTVLDLDIPIDIWEKYYAHVKFHDIRCANCSNCIMNVCRDSCVTEDPDFEPQTYHNILVHGYRLSLTPMPSYHQ